MSDLFIPESGHGFESDPEWDTAWDSLESPYEEPFYAGYEDYEPNPYDGTYSEL